VKIAVLRRCRADLTLIWAAAHAQRYGYKQIRIDQWKIINF
jgi:hypothetical protein